jgi:hypothetical protein
MTLSVNDGDGRLNRQRKTQPQIRGAAQTTGAPPAATQTQPQQNTHNRAKGAAAGAAVEAVAGDAGQGSGCRNGS